MSILASNEFYEISIANELAILNVKSRVFDFITDVTLTDKLSAFILGIDHNPDIKALIFYNDPESLNEENYDRFIQGILQRNESSNECDPPCFCEKNTRFREIISLNKIIRNIASLQKIVISGIQGNVVTPFVGASMVADFRYASEDAVFSMIHNKYGLHPSGGLPFFLTNYLNHSKAMEIQLSDKIDAEKAFDLGLLTKILPTDNFIHHLLEEVKKYTAIKYCTIRDTKRLTNFNRNELRDYFEYEASLLNL
ncbi:MAG: enoyl-CoA hydratase/isomerase family protein [Bacteroidales bacterium]